MISVSYRGMPLDILQTLAYTREVLLDRSGTTYECTRVRMSLIVNYNPGAVSFAPPIGVSPPSPAAGRMPAQTDTAIRAFLEQPRGVLVATSLDQAGNPVTVLRSPQPPPGSLSIPVCDVRNGPFCRVNSIQAVQGERLWRISLEIETFINETPTPFLVLSNRWSSHMDTDWQALSRRVYQGVCTVRGDFLRTAGLGAPVTGQIDSLRNSFANFTVPNGWQRSGIKVTATADGNSALYEFVDSQQLFNKQGAPFKNVPRIEVQDSNWLWNTGAGRGAIAAMNATASARPSDWSWKFAAMGGPVWSYIFNASGNLGGSIANNLPKRYKNVLVRVWGNSIANRLQLIGIASSVAQYRMYGNNGPPLFDVAAYEMLITADTNNYVTLSFTAAWDYQTTIAGIPVGIIPALGFLPGAEPGPGDGSFVSSVALSPETPFNDVLSGAGAITQNPATINPPMGGSAGDPTRGTSLVQLVTQVLESFNTAPGAVP